MHFLLEYVKGIAIGAGAILPGVSSGVLCVIFGIYEKLINSVLGFFHDWKKNTSFLLPIVLGCFTGVLLFSNILEYLFSHFPMQTKYSFMGLILGSVPILLKQANQQNSKKGFRLHYLCYLFLSLAFTCFLLWVENHIGSTETVCVSYSFHFLVICGFLMSVGVVFPGVSNSVILMSLGVYDIYLSSISNLNFTFLFPMGIGLILGGFFFLKLIQILLKNFPTETYYAIIGFVLGSLPVLYPGFTFNATGIASLLFFTSCLFIGYYGEKK